MCFCGCMYENSFGDCMKPFGEVCKAEEEEGRVLEEDEIDKEIFG